MADIFDIVVGKDKKDKISNDIFDRIAAGQQGDIFDAVAQQPKGDVFDQIAPEPEFGEFIATTAEAPAAIVGAEPLTVAPPVTPQAPSEATFGEIGVAAVKSVIPALGQAVGGMRRLGAEAELEKIEQIKQKMLREGTAFEGDVNMAAFKQFVREGGITTTEEGLPTGPLTLKKERELKKKVSEAAALSRGATEVLQEIQPKNLVPGSPKYLVNLAAQSFAQMLLPLSFSLVAKNPVPAMIAIGAQVKGASFGELREAGFDLKTAKLASNARVITEAIPEALPLGVLLKPGSKMLSRMLKTAGAESFQEGVTETLNIGVDMGILDMDMTWGEAVDRIGTSMTVGAIAGPALGAVAQPFVRGVEPTVEPGPPTAPLAEEVPTELPAAPVPPPGPAIPSAITPTERAVPTQAIQQKIERVAEEAAVPITPQAEIPIEGLPKRAININLERIDADQSVKGLINETAKQFEGSIDESRRGVITQEQTRLLADELGMDVKKLLGRKKGQAFNAEEVTAARDILNSSATELNQLRQSAVVENSDEALVRFRQAHLRHAAIQAEVSGIAAEAGRALQALRIPSIEVRNFKAMLDSLGGREVNEAVAEQLSKIDPTDTAAVNQFIRESAKATTSDKIYELWINALLSSPKTHAVNITSNTLNTILRPLETTAEVAADILLPGKRTRSLREIPGEAFGVVQGLREGLPQAIRAFNTETSQFGIDKLDQTTRQALKGPLGKAARIPGRLLIAADEFFKILNYSMTINRLAYKDAARKNFKGPEAVEHIAELISNPTQEMKDTGVSEANYRTFQKDLGSFGKLITKARNAVEEDGSRSMSSEFVRYIIPFVRTPINIVKFGLERSAANIPRVGFKLARGDYKGNRQALLEDVTRASMGGVITMILVGMYDDDLLTGAGPIDKEQRDNLRRTGWQPYSIKIGDEWYQYGRLEPLGMTMGLVSDFMELGKLTDSESMRKDMMKKAFLSVTNNLINKSYMQGIQKFMLAMHEPARYGDDWIRSFATTAIPRAIANEARAQDPYLRRVENIKEAFKSQLPGMSQQLLPRLNVWGEPIGRAGGPISKRISPIAVSKIKRDPVDEEIIRLGLEPAQPRPIISGVKLTPAEHNRYIVLSGMSAKKFLDKFITEETYNILHDDSKAEVVNGVLKEFRKLAKQEMLFELTYEDLGERPEFIELTEEGEAFMLQDILEGIVRRIPGQFRKKILKERIEAVRRPEEELQ